LLLGNAENVDTGDTWCVVGERRKKEEERREEALSSEELRARCLGSRGR
jgi:hypothetical protein